MDGAKVAHRNSAIRANVAQMSSKAWGLCQSRGVNRGGTAPSADLGVSSKYSEEHTEG